MFLILTSMIFGLLEIEIEGEDGWAKNLPTFQVKSITGYHLFLWIFMLLMIHLPVFFVKKYTMTLEMFLLSFYLLMLITEDAFWFFFNTKFHKSQKPDEWREPKFLTIPYFYFIAAPLILVLSYFSSRVWFYYCVVLLFFIAISYKFQVIS